MNSVYGSSSSTARGVLIDVQRVIREISEAASRVDEKAALVGGYDEQLDAEVYRTLATRLWSQVDALRPYEQEAAARHAQLRHEEMSAR